MFTTALHAPNGQFSNVIKYGKNILPAQRIFSSSTTLLCNEETSAYHRPSKAEKLLLYRSYKTRWSFSHQVLIAMLFPK